MIAGIPPTAVLVFDFDGVACGSLDECLYISWCAHTGMPVPAAGENGFGAVPADVAERFRRARPYMRHLAHFLVPLLEGPAVTDRAAFEERFANLPDGRADAFATAAGEFRAALRREHRKRWLELHTVEPGVAALLDGAYVATARDRSSVTEILGAHGVWSDPAKIYESLKEKPPALASIAEREGVRPQDVWLIDDSIANCLEAQAAGFGTAWASWGFHDIEDEVIAREHGILVLTLDDLPA